MRCTQQTNSDAQYWFCTSILPDEYITTSKKAGYVEIMGALFMLHLKLHHQV